jgi:hypothetical protein
VAHSLSYRLPALLVASAAASVLAAAPALATEGPAAPPPAATLPSGVAPVTIAPFPSTTAPSLRSRSPRLIRRARLVHKRVRQGRRGLLRVSLATPSRLRVVLRGPSGRRIRAISAPARGRTVALRLPARTGGHNLRPGRYRVSVQAIDATGARSLPVRLTMTVHRGARH